VIPLPDLTSPNIKPLEVTWLVTTCAYECFDETQMADTDWDKLGQALHERRHQWSPYFASAIPGGREGDFNPGTTGSGLDWRKGVCRVFYAGLVGVYGRDPLGIVRA
jgi:hypothetical protein